MQINSSELAAIVPEQPKNQLNTGDFGTIPVAYHKDELKIHNRINNTAIGIIIAGFILIFGAIICMIITGNITIGVIGSCSGVITETISGVLFWFVTKSSDDKWKYFRALSETEERDKLIELINGSVDLKFRQKMTEKLVCTYCENHKK